MKNQTPLARLRPRASTPPTVVRHAPFAALLCAASLLSAGSPGRADGGASTRPDVPLAHAETRPPTNAPSPAPSPDLHPDQVVRIVMEAMRDNGDDDNGIATTFAFASPSNKKMTGPLSHFARVVKSPAYKPMLHSKAIEYRAVEIEEGAARQVVIITDSDGNSVGYVFILSLQGDGPFKGCWMTDGVMRLDSGEDAPLDQGGSGENKA